MRPIREITAEEENFRIENCGGFGYVRRDPVKPEPEGTIVLVPFRIAGYDPDCDGSLMMRLENVDEDGEYTGWTAKNIGLSGGDALVVEPDELKRLLARGEGPKGG